MKVEQRKLIDFLGEPAMQLVVPIYQRVYSWTRPQLRELWDDLMALGDETAASAGGHFMGAVFFSEEARKSDGLRRLNLIDGQQRMTTITLLLCAVSRFLGKPENTGVTFCGLDATGIVERFLEVRSIGGEPACKLVLSRADAPTLRWVEGLGQRPSADDERSELIVDALEWFQEHLAADGFDLDSLQRGMEGLYIVTVQMEEGDRQQTVFESLNAKGLPLSTPDLVRNFLLMQHGFADDAHLYDAYWTRVEDAFSADPDDRYLSHAIRLWLGTGPQVKDDRGIFEAFKRRFSTKEPEKLETMTQGLADYCIDFHERVASGDEVTLKACRDWEESLGKAERLRNDRKIFGD